MATAIIPAAGDEAVTKLYAERAKDAGCHMMANQVLITAHTPGCQWLRPYGCVAGSTAAKVMHSKAFLGDFYACTGLPSRSG
jgi:hypothetical protein